MITTLTPNPCIDKTLATEKFDLYKMNRVRVLRSDFGGKGINVSSALKNLGAETCCLGFSFSEDDAALHDFMKARAIPCGFVTLPGKMRTCYKIFDESLHHTIEINEYGSEIDAEAGEKLLSLLAEKAAASSFVTLSGSLPKGLSDDFYLRCIRTVKKNAPSCRIVLDAEKKVLLQALEGTPSILKPNIHEFQDTFGCSVHSLKQLNAEAKKILAHYGLEILCVSLGAEGAYITDGRESWHCRAPKVEVRSIQGAGDSVVAGMCLAMERGKTLPEILRYGVAAAGDSISREGTQLCTAEGMKKLLEQDIGLERL